MSSCNCQGYSHLRLDTGSIYDRLAETRRLLPDLKLMAEHEEGRHKVFQCHECSQHWQHSPAWSWNNVGYIFKVPKVEPEVWRKEPYLPPDDMTRYNKALREYVNPQSVSEREVQCDTSGCDRQAVSLSVMCLRHHVEWMQKKGCLMRKPAGKIFAPYSYDEHGNRFILDGET